MNAPHQLNKPLTYMPITDSYYGLQEKCSVSISLGQNYATHAGRGIRAWVEYSVQAKAIDACIANSG